MYSGNSEKERIKTKLHNNVFFEGAILIMYFLREQY